MNRVFITGANRGIGLSLTQQYLNLGWHVHATYRCIESSQALIDLAEHHSNLSCHQLDITDYPSVQALASQLPNLDLLISNAGYYGPKNYGFGHTDVDEWRKVFEINSIAPQKLVEAFYPLLEKSSQPKIACISSKVGSMTENTAGGGYLYRSSKAALNSVVKSLSNDLKPVGVTVLALHPGWVQTDMGGSNAPIDTKTSALGLIEVIKRSDIEQSGHFISYDGTQLPW